MLRKPILLAVLCGFLAAARAQQIEIKMGTIAPDGSPWYKVLEQMGERWRNLSGGKVKLRIYTTLGDEPDLVNKLRINQIQAVALSGAGISEIEKGVMCLQIPLLYESYAELDCVRDRMAPQLEKRIESRGYIVLNWGDTGWVHFFSRTRLTKVDELRKMKLFTWDQGDAEEVQVWKDSGFHPVPLAATDILLGLQTGLIDVVPEAPLFALWNQSFGLAPYMSDFKWAPLVGATVVSKAAWEKIPAELSAPMLQAARDSGIELRSKIRSMGDEAIKVMTAGQPGKHIKVEVTHADAATLAAWRQETEAAYPKMRGKLFPAELFDEARRLCEECRARMTRASK